METEIERWYKRLWMTKGARFNAAKRMENHDIWSICTISICSVYVICLNLLVFIPDQTPIFSDDYIALLTLCCSVLILVLSIIIASMNYKLRASRFHDCGREINTVYDEICIWKHTNKVTTRDELLELGKKYYSILDKYENHKRIDYLKFKAENINEYYNETGLKNAVYPIFFRLYWICATSLLYLIFILLPLILFWMA